MSYHPVHSRPGQPALALSAACAVLVLVLGLPAGAACAQTADTAEMAQVFDAAMLDYERNHWAEAYAAFGQLADRGHRDAARIALQMWRYGPALYGTSFAADAQQVERWSRLLRSGIEPTGRSGQVTPRAP
jgi:hypothetical protein